MLEEEDYILKSPMRRIHKIKTKQQVKEIISDEAIEKLRDHCACQRDLAMIVLFYSTGILLKKESIKILHQDGAKLMKLIFCGKRDA